LLFASHALRELYPDHASVTIPNPYLIEPPPWGSRDYQPAGTGEAPSVLVFHMVLVGRARLQLSLIILAWQRALAHRLGSGEGKAELERVVLEHPDGDDQLVFDAETGLLLEHDATLELRFDPVGGERTLQLQLLTPLRIQQHGHPLGVERLTLREVVRSLARRVSLLTGYHIQRPAERSVTACGDRTFNWQTWEALDMSALLQQAEAMTVTGKLWWRDWNRWSSRQEQEMTLGGVVGCWSLAGAWEGTPPEENGDHGETVSLLHLLYLGQWVHVGKNATFGLGGYRLAWF
jgi:hypothetical protein